MDGRITPISCKAFTCSCIASNFPIGSRRGLCLKGRSSPVSIWCLMSVARPRSVFDFANTSPYSINSPLYRRLSSSDISFLCLLYSPFTCSGIFTSETSCCTGSSAATRFTKTVSLIFCLDSPEFGSFSFLTVSSVGSTHGCIAKGEYATPMTAPLWIFCTSSVPLFNSIGKHWFRARAITRAATTPVRYVNDLVASTTSAHSSNSGRLIRPGTT